MDPEVVDDLLEVEAVEVDEEEFETHLNNYGKIQQTNVTGQDRIAKQGIVLCGRLIEIIHGMDAGKPCTFAIFEWYVHANAPDKRFKFAQISISFKSSTGNAQYDPAVVDCFPWGAFSLASWTKKLEKTRGWHPTVSLGYEDIVSLDNAFVYDLTETVDRDEHVYVNGGPMLADNYTDPDHLTAVQWNLFESEGQHSGFPRYFRTAVLLGRKEGDTSRFTAKIDLKFKVSFVEDTKEKMKAFLGRNVKDEPVNFDPGKPPTTHRFDTILKALSGISLKDECVFLLFKKFSDAQDRKKDDQGANQAQSQNQQQ